jgi:hypothetical protein
MLLLCSICFFVSPFSSYHIPPETASILKGRCRSSALQRVKNLRGKLFYPKNILIFVSLRGRIAAVAIFKPKVWHSVAKHGSTNKQEYLLQKMGFAASFRETIFRYGMTNRIVKDCRVGRKKCALLAMTNLVG